MSTNTELLQFLDGTLDPESEAELLHRLSVSPERRELLRSFINQQALFQSDRNSIAVPFSAEQKLWARLGEMMPVAVQNAAVPATAVVETVAASASRTGIFSSAFSATSVVVICLLLGLGSGFLIGKNSNGSSEIASSWTAPVPASGAAHDVTPGEASHEQVINITRNIITSGNSSSHTLQNIGSENAGAPLVENTPTVNNINNSNVNTILQNSESQQAALVNPVTPKQVDEHTLNTAFMRDPSQFSMNSPFDFSEMTPAKSVIQRFEFYFNEGIGKQFPNNAATNTSMPVVTNSSIATLFQVFPKYENLWVGGSFGTANITEKKFRISQVDPTDPKSQNEMVADLVHVQTSYFGGLLQYRIPVSRTMALTATLNAESASAGMIYGGELGVHYDATSDVGIVLGVRGTHINYNIDGQQQQVIHQGITDFGTTASAAANQPSYNFEISSGIYFHF